MTLPPILQSRKFQGALVGAVLLAVPVLFRVTDSQIPRADKEAIVEHFVTAVATLFGVAIGGTALEDAAEKHKPNDPPESALSQSITQIASSPTEPKGESNA